MMKDLNRKNAGEVEKASPQKSKGAVAIAALLIVALALSGCYSQLRDALEPGNSPPEEPPEPELQVVDRDNASIKVKFGVTELGKGGVAAAFTELHEFIVAGGLDEDVIHLGDYIDLEAGLTVEAYTGSVEVTITADKSVEAITIGSEDWGTLGRLIVVGINSFRSNGTYIYQGEDTPPAHVVFQFQNLPVTRRMNPSEGPTGGYAASEMREYLVPVAGEGGGVFLAGLQDAGVPGDVLWAPGRAVFQGGAGSAVIRDKLWLPTEREMVQDGISYNAWDKSKSGPYSANGETEFNQARLAYYTSAADNPSGQNTDAGNKLRWKVFPFPRSENAPIDINNDPGYWYWTASVISDYFTGFCTVNPGGYNSSVAMTNIGGVAPAFCVY